MFIESHVSTDDQSETSTESSEDDESGNYLDKTENNQPDLLQLFVYYWFD